MSLKLAVFTATRAEYGILRSLLMLCKSSAQIELQLMVGGSHLVEQFGHTEQHIINDGFTACDRLDFLKYDDSALGTTKAMALALSQAGEALAKHQPDLVMIVGDRYEALAFAQASALQSIPVAHLHGGELTEGAVDDAFRHAITKLSQLHFTSTECYRQRVIQLGEQPEQVHYVGAPGLDNIDHVKLLDKEQTCQRLGVALDSPFFLITYHPETLAESEAVSDIQQLFAALTQFPQWQIVFTAPNADVSGRQLIAAIKDFQQQSSLTVRYQESLGSQLYFSAVTHSALVVGNSSSGIIEVPSFATPTINIGDRQKGREAASSIVHCVNEQTAITQAIKTGLAMTKDELESTVNPYFRGNASQRILEVLESGAIPGCKKQFYDLRCAHVLE